MGTYTKLRADIKLKADTPDNVLDKLEQLMDSEPTMGNALFVGNQLHALWDDPRYSCISGAISEDIDDQPYYQFPLLKIRCEVKNYTKVIQKFLNWIEPYTESIEGTYHVEDCDALTLEKRQVLGQERIVVNKHVEAHPFSDAEDETQVEVISNFLSSDL